MEKPHQRFVLYLYIYRQIDRQIDRQAISNFKLEVYGPIIPKPIWALQHGSIVWPKASTSTWPKISIQTRKGNEPILSETQGLDSRQQFTFGLSVLSLSVRSSLSKTAVVQSLRCLCTRQCLREYHRRACLLKWEPFPKPLSPKTHLKLMILDPSTHQLQM